LSESMSIKNELRVSEGKTIVALAGAILVGLPTKLGVCPSVNLTPYVCPAGNHSKSKH